MVGAENSIFLLFAMNRLSARVVLVVVRSEYALTAKTKNRTGK